MRRHNKSRVKQRSKFKNCLEIIIFKIKCLDQKIQSFVKTYDFLEDVFLTAIISSRLMTLTKFNRQYDIFKSRILFAILKKMLSELRENLDSQSAKKYVIVFI